MLLFILLACGNDDSIRGKVRFKTEENVNSSDPEENVNSQEPKISKLSTDLQQSKDDMCCIKEYITAQQKTPNQKIDFDLFEKTKCLEKR